MNFILENEKRILTQFLLHNITKISVSFSGSGDSGQIDYIYAESNGNKANIKDIHLLAFSAKRAVFNTATKEWVSEPRIEKLMTLEELIDLHVYEVLENTNVDWYNNDGGQGEWSWNSSTNELLFEVTVNTVITETAHIEERKLGQEKELKE